eukprot:354542_1
MGNEQTAEPEQSEPLSPKHFKASTGSLRINTKEISFPNPKRLKRHFRSSNTLLDLTPTHLDASPLSNISQSSPITPHSTPRSSALLPNTCKKMSTERILSCRIIKLALDFWSRQIDTLSLKQRLELGCSIFIPHTELTTHFKSATDLEAVSLKYLDMIGFTVRTVGNDAARASVLLQKLGAVHDAMHIDIQSYAIMLSEMHRVFGVYFPRHYTEAVRFALDETFTYCVQLMTGTDLKICNALDNVAFMNSLDACLASDIGREYLFRYLHQVWCDEIVFFLQLSFKYRCEKEDKKRYVIARNIHRFCMKPKGVLVVNVSYECRRKVMQQMSECELHGVMDKDMFEEVENEICSLIVQSHWFRFKVNVLEIYLKD